MEQMENHTEASNWKGLVKGMENLGEMWENWRIVKKWALKEQCVRVWTHLIWLIVGDYDGQMQDPRGEIHILPKCTLTSQKELPAVDLVLHKT